MSTIAIAGGTGQLGRALVDALVAQGKYKVIVLARETSPEKEKELGASIIRVDYSDVAAIKTVLEENDVGTLIAAMNIKFGPSPEKNLVAAAEASSVTKRYIPSTWGGRHEPEFAAYFAPAKGKAEIEAMLESTSLEWTSVLVGFYTDFWLSPKVPSYIRPYTVWIDVVNDTAALPGTGDNPICFTHTFDLAKYVAALMTLPPSSWTKESLVVADKMTLNQFVEIVQEVKGTKFKVTYDSLESCKNGQVTELPSHPPLYPFFPKHAVQGLLSAVGRAAIEGEFGLDKRAETVSLNELFPEIKARSVRELITAAWAE